MARPKERRREGITPALLTRDAEEIVAAAEAKLITRGTAIRLLTELIQKQKDKRGRDKHKIAANRVRRMLFELMPESEELYELMHDPRTGYQTTDIYDIEGLRGFLGWIHSGGIAFPVFGR
jgi:hypothetical protein